MRNARALRRSAAHSHASLVRELHSFAKQAGLPPIEGSTLVPAKKITKKDRLLLLRARQEEELASTKLQGLFRVRTAKHEMCICSERNGAFTLLAIQNPMAEVDVVGMAQGVPG